MSGFTMFHYVRSSSWIFFALPRIEKWSDALAHMIGNCPLSADLSFACSVRVRFSDKAVALRRDEFGLESMVNIPRIDGC